MEIMLQHFINTKAMRMQWRMLEWICGLIRCQVKLPM